MTRSTLAEVRNPVMALPSYARLAELDANARGVLSDILRDIATDAAARAEQSWRKSKGPMAAYWKAVSVYAKHIKHALKVRP